MAIHSRRLAGALALAAAALLLSPAASEAQVKLQWKFKKGEKLNYEMVQTSEIKNAAGNMKIKQVMDMGWQVDEVASDGAATITMKIKRVRASMSGGLVGNVEYDSDKKGGAADNPVARQMEKSMGPLINTGFTYTLAPTGEIKNMKLSDEAKAALKKVGAAGKGGLGGGFNEDTIKQMAGQMGAVFPKTPVTKGKTWDHTMKAKLPFGDMENKSTFKLAGTESKGGQTVAKIDVTSKFNIKPKAGFPGKVTIADKGSKGTSWFAVESGRLVRSDITQNMDIGLAIGGQNVTMTMKSTTSMTLKK